MSIEARAAVGRRVHDSEGQPVGRITAVYRYAPGVNAPWGAAEVTHRRILRSLHLVDLRNATLDGDVVTVPHSRTTIYRAPDHQPMIGNTLSERHSAEVIAHYETAA